MKILKIVVAVIFATIGVLFSVAEIWIGAALAIGIAAVILLKSPKKADSPASKATEASVSKPKEDWIFEKEIHSKLVGVSFANEDGSSRQDALADLRDELAEETAELDPEDDDEIEGVRLKVESYEWQGAPAIRVKNGTDELGNLSAELAEEIARKWSSPDYQIRLYAIEVTGNKTLGCNVRLEVWHRRQ